MLSLTVTPSVRLSTNLRRGGDAGTEVMKGADPPRMGFEMRIAGRRFLCWLAVVLGK